MEQPRGVPCLLHLQPRGALRLSVLSERLTPAGATCSDDRQQAIVERRDDATSTAADDDNQRSAPLQVSILNCCCYYFIIFIQIKFLKI